MSRLVELRDVGCAKDKDNAIFSRIEFNINEGDVLVLQGKSGSGKTTLLKCIAHLNIYTGQILYRGRTAKSYGVPSFRTKVSYVPQRPALLSGTPRDFLAAISTFSSRKLPKSVGGHAAPTFPLEIANAWGIDEELWDRNWTNLSGGESQRIALATALGLNTAEVLLLDEPTSALDPQSTALVERFIINELRSPESELKAVVWITHSEEQGRRIGTRFLRISSAGCEEEPRLVDP
ncbi:P-loop containing nucleoside triphosphate hydrolase protein [Phlebopus sp. FC_14]|nr:P-loop containing nucleoside triphosphate hydrolase protein [Phlebopus sp. FC_14]